MNYIVVWINERVSKERVTDSLSDINKRILNRREEVDILMRGIQSLSGSPDAQFRNIGNALLPFYQIVHINKSADEVSVKEIELDNMQNLEEQRNGRLQLISDIRNAVERFPNDTIKNHFKAKFLPIVDRMERANTNARAMAAQQSQFQSLIGQAQTAVQTLNNETNSARTAATSARTAATTAQSAAQNAINAATGATTSASGATSAASDARTAAANAREQRDNAIATNGEMDVLNQEAENYLQNTANALQLGGGSAVAEAVISPFTNLCEGLVNQTTTDYTDEQLRTFARALTAQQQANLEKSRLLQASELLTQRDTVANNIIMDYMYTNEKGTTVNSTIDKLSQLNNDKKRKLEINTYYNKSREQYINILKVIVLACIIVVPLVIANKNKIIPNTLFMILTVVIIFFTIIFIFSSFVDIYKRDNIDFDKITIPYDRESILLEKDGTITKKKNPLSSLTLTCIGQDCCDGSMVYDSIKNKCIATENFGNAFDTFGNMNDPVSIVYPNNSEGFNNLTTKNTLIQNSLACSSIDNLTTAECMTTQQHLF